MTKKYFAIIITLLLFIAAKSQNSITPDINTEFCPNQEIVFTVTLATSATNIFVTGLALNVPPTITQNAYGIVSGANTVFNFKGKFIDNNNKQTFQVSYKDGTGTAQTYKPSFTKIKSFLTANSFSQINPTPTSIISPPCQINSHTISFTNVQFGNPFEFPPIGYGTVTTYEYLLPSGWVLNGTTSNGSTWIAGNNSVTVTSDKVTGGNIIVRAVNVCGAGLIKGQETTININRAKPALTFIGGFTVCTSQNFQANAVPSWVTNYNWTVTPNTVFANPNPTANPTTVTKLGDGEGDISLVISTAACPLTFNYNTLEITGKPKLVAGKPFVSSTTPLLIYYAPGDENELCRYTENTIQMNTGTGSTTSLSYVSHTGSPQPSWALSAPDDIYVYFFKSTQNTLVLKMDVSNTCGITSYNFGFKAITCAGLLSSPANNTFRISPNPITNLINIYPIQILGSTEVAKQISEVIIYDINHNIVANRKFKNTSMAQIALSNLKTGTYYATIKCGQYAETQTILKQ